VSAIDLTTKEGRAFWLELQRRMPAEERAQRAEREAQLERARGSLKRGGIEEDVLVGCRACDQQEDAQ
jgi:hypothetical protein